jgi:hypothetical protein
MITRRSLLATAALALVAPARAAQSGLAAAAPGVNPILLDRALAALARHDHALWSRDVVAIADFGLPSAEPRFHLIDLIAGTTRSLRVTHGKGSDPDHTGRLQTFSDVSGSNATAAGAYLTGASYIGTRGHARRLIGLDPTNANAAPRAIVIHAAWYAEPGLVATQGRLGRSDGCFAVAQRDLETVLARLGPGRLLYAGRA